MSRHIVSNPGEFNLIASSLFTGHENLQHRKLVCLENASAHWLPSHNAEHIPGICVVPAQTIADRADRITHLLGQEYRVMVHELSEPLDAGLLAALAGTVQAGGVLLLVAPRTLNTASCANPDNVSHFGRRFYRLLDHHETLFPNAIHRCMAASANLQVSALTTALSLATPHAGEFSGALYQSAQREQDELLQQACHFLSDSEPGCITITGRRGRGKSTLLGKIAAWLTDQHRDYAVTAANSAALNSFHHSVKSPQRVVVDPHRIDTSAASVLLVDEAGNLPISLLEKLLSLHHHVIFCTTVEGYESAGRAFEIRFTAHIDTMNRRRLCLTPRVSWRWGADDPVEHFINAMVLSAAPDAQHQSAAATPIDISQHQYLPLSVRELSQSELAEDEITLRRVFHLLRKTHYQTTVQDLQHLVDGDGVRLWVLHAKQWPDILGVIVVSVEGCVDATLHSDIVNKRRRLQHQLLPQLLAQMANSPDALSQRYARVIRISIDTPYRQRGLGSMMLKTVESSLMNDSADLDVRAFGASFAADPISKAFWRSNHYDEFHVGHRLNPRTGLHSVAVIKSFNTTVSRVAQQAIRIHQDNQHWRDSANETQRFDDRHDEALLTQFANGQRSAQDTHAALSRLANRGLIHFPMSTTGSQRKRDNDLRQQVATFLETSQP